MKPRIFITLALAVLFSVPALRAQETNHWTFEVTLYGLAPSMSGNVAVKGVPADLDLGFDKIWDDLHSAGMGTVRVGYDRWALSTDVIYMDLQGTKGQFTVGIQQLMMLPALEYRVHQQMTVFAGAEYNRLNLDLGGPRERNPSGTQDWWDPIVGAQLSQPLGSKFSLNVRGDIGGFGAASDLTCQAYPYVNWQFTTWDSLQLGYRWVYADYETGSDRNYFKYDVLTQGPQLGVAFTF